MGYFESLRNAFHKATGTGTIADPFVPVVSSAIDQTTPGTTNGVVVAGKGVTYTDKSGTVTSGGVAQTLAAVNASRTGLLVQNLSTGDLWINSLATAVAAQPSIWIPAGAYFEFPSTGMPLTAISIYGATTGQAFAAREW